LKTKNLLTIDAFMVWKFVTLKCNKTRKRVTPKNFLDNPKHPPQKNLAQNPKDPLPFSGFSTYFQNTQRRARSHPSGPGRVAWSCTCTRISCGWLEGVAGPVDLDPLPPRGPPDFELRWSRVVRTQRERREFFLAGTSTSTTLTSCVCTTSS